MNRRGFLKALSAVAIVGITPLKYVAPELHARAVRVLTFTEMVTETLRKHRPALIANLTAHNSLLKRLQERER